jgi:hypothetical protein
MHLAIRQPPAVTPPPGSSGEGKLIECQKFENQIVFMKCIDNIDTSFAMAGGWNASGSL